MYLQCPRLIPIIQQWQQKQTEKYDPFSRQKIINKWQLRDELEVGMIKDFKAAIISVLQEVKENTLEINEKIDHLSREIEKKKKEPNRKYSIWC